MADLISIEVNDQEVRDLLNRLQSKMSSMAPVFADIAQAMESETESNFAKQAGPLGAWPRLSEATIASRLKVGTWPGRILQVTGGLARSVVSASGSDFARISSSMVYSAIHQFGGLAGRGRSVRIPARPYLPVHPDGRLQDSADRTITEILNAYLSTP